MMSMPSEVISRDAVPDCGRASATTTSNAPRIFAAVGIQRARTRLETAVMSQRGAYREILDVAERDGSDLIVMGVVGRSAADMFFFGSTTNHVVRQAGCPVLTVRAAGDGSGEPERH